MITLEELWEKSIVSLFDMDAVGFNRFVRLADYDITEDVPGYISSEMMMKYAKSEVTEISWHNIGIAVRFDKGDEDEEQHD